MIVIQKTTISLKTGNVISNEIIGPAGVSEEDYYKGLFNCLFSQNDFKNIIKSCTAQQAKDESFKSKKNQEKKSEAD